MSKVNFNEIYKQPTPELYIQEMKNLNYFLIDNSFEYLIQCFKDIERVGQIVHCDLCCGYGYLTYQILKRTNLVECIREFEELHFSNIHNFEIHSPIYTIGIDKSAEAIQYGINLRLYNLGLALDLEQFELPIYLNKIDLVTCFGGIGYISINTIKQLFRKTNVIRKILFSCLTSICCKEILLYLRANGYQINESQELIKQRSSNNQTEYDWYKSTSEENGHLEIANYNDNILYSKIYVATLCREKAGNKAYNGHVG